MKIKFALLIVALSLSLSNCKKDKQNSPKSLTSKTWRRGLIDKNPATNPTGKVLYYAAETCERDDTFKFGKDGKLTINRNNHKCDPNEIKIESQPYTLDTIAKKLIIDGTEYTLAEASLEQIKYYSTVPEGVGFESLIYLLQ